MLDMENTAPAVRGKEGFWQRWERVGGLRENILAVFTKLPRSSPEIYLRSDPRKHQ